MLGNSLKIGDKAFLFIYSPNSIFYMQEVKIIPTLPRVGEGSIRVIIKGKAISTDEAKHKIGKRASFANNNLIKSPEYVKNVLKQFGRRLIKNIFERMF